MSIVGPSAIASLSVAKNRKAPDLLLRALAMTKAKVLGLVMVGDCPMAEELRLMASRLRVSNRVDSKAHSLKALYVVAIRGLPLLSFHQYPKPCLSLSPRPCRQGRQS